LPFPLPDVKSPWEVDEEGEVQALQGRFCFGVRGKVNKDDFAE
jgi:hypothetical protein